MLGGLRLFAGLLPLVAVCALACEGGPSPGPSPTAESETPTAVATVVSSPTAELADVPAVPDPFELYVMKADGSERKLLSSSPGPAYLLWSPVEGRAVVVVDIAPQESELHFVTLTDEAAGARAAVGGVVLGGVWSPKWSPTGAWLAYIRSPQKSAVLEVIRADGSGREELTASEGDVKGISVAGWTGADTLVATRWDGSRSVVMEFNLTTGESREVAILAGTSYSTISNDGRTTAVIVSAPGKSCERGSMPNTLWLVDVATGQSRRAVGETCYLGASVAWSPDDSLIAYSVAPGPEDPPGVYVLDVASGSTRRLSSTPDGFDSVLNWLNDASGVLVRRYPCYACEGGAPPSLLYMPATGSGEQPVVDKAEFAVSPDNRSVVFAKDGLQVSGIFGGASQTLVPPDPDWTLSFMSYLSWSPDREWVTLVRYHSDVARRFEVNADGTGLTRLSDLQDRTAVPPPLGAGVRVLSPDGSRVAVLVRESHGIGIDVMNADGTGARRVVATDPFEHYEIRGIRWKTNDRLYFVSVPHINS